MPAVTVQDLTTLARLDRPGLTSLPRPVVKVTTAPSGLEGEGFPVRRAFHGVSMAELDPFIHMDQMGEVQYAPGEPKGTPWHPHRGFETVTYMIDGTFVHQDSIGGGGLIENGGTQWMTAGAGILHIERPPEALIASGWPVPRHPAVGEPAGERQDGRAALPGHRARGRLARHDPRRRGARARHRRIRRRHRGPGRHAHPRRPGARDRHAGRPARTPWDPTFNALVYALAGAGSVGTERTRCTRASSPSWAPVTHSSSLRTTARTRGPTRSRSSSSADGPSRSRSPSTGRS